MGTRFILFSLARCGSTTLMRVLNCHPDIRCIAEPFNAKHIHRQYWERVKDSASLDDTLEEIWKTYNGIKHIWDARTWPFEPSLNEHLLLRPDHRVLFLNRRNSLRRLVSLQLSEQTDVWHMFTESDRKRVTEWQFKPINADMLGVSLYIEKQVLHRYRKLLAEKRRDFLELWYEDLYNPLLGAKQRLERLNQILTFLRLDRIADGQTASEMNQLFDPGNTGFNSRAIYSKVPGIEEIEARFGSDETGWLFERGSL